MNPDSILRDVDIALLEGSARLITWETGRARTHGQPFLGYSFTVNGQELFRGEDYSVGMATAVDSDESLLGLLGFLTLRPGDTDREYFDAYTDAQMQWAQSSVCEYLAADVSCLENPEYPYDHDLVLFTDR